MVSGAIVVIYICVDSSTLSPTSIASPSSLSLMLLYFTTDIHPRDNEAHHRSNYLKYHHPLKLILEKDTQFMEKEKQEKHIYDNNTFPLRELYVQSPTGVEVMVFKYPSQSHVRMLSILSLSYEEK